MLKVKDQIELHIMLQKIMKLKLQAMLEKPGSIPKRLKDSSDSLIKLPNLKKLTDFMDMLKPSETTFKKSTTVLTSTTLSLNQDFTLLNLSSTTLKKKLLSLKMLNSLGKKPSQLMKLRNQDTALSLGLDLLSSKTLNTKLITPERSLNNTSKFLTSPQLGKTKSREELNST